MLPDTERRAVSLQMPCLYVHCRWMEFRTSLSGAVVRSTEMVRKEGRGSCRVWHAELVFFVVVCFVISCTVTADPNTDQQLPGSNTQTPLLLVRFTVDSFINILFKTMSRVLASQAEAIVRTMHRPTWPQHRIDIH